MKILITGGAGFIGSHVADEYINNGHEVVIVDNLSSGNINNINKKAKFYLLDICSPLLNEIFKIERPDIVNHHASQISVVKSVKEPSYDANVNIIGSLNLLQSCIKNGIKKFIFISSGGAVYGEADKFPITEDCSTNPICPYGISKLTIENYLLFYKKQYNLDYTILRYSNVYGPRQVVEGEAGVVSIFINKLLNNEIPVIYAYPKQSQGMIRDYIYVADVAKSNTLALEKGSYHSINISSKIETTTQVLYNKIIKILNKNILPKKEKPRKGEIEKSCLDNQKALEILGWKPERSLDQGLKITFDYFSNIKKI